jgi:hypothetical protein
MKPLTRAAILSALFVASAVGCAQSSNGADSLGANAPGGGPAIGGGSTSPGADGAAVLPPETKVESDYQSPVATGRIIWTANPVSGRVAYVDAMSFNVQTVRAGDGPTYLAAVPSADATVERSIVINVRSHDATLLSRDGQGNLTRTMFPSTADANSWAISPSGRWAIAWTDAARLPNADDRQGFQDVAVLDLTGPASSIDAGPGVGSGQILSIGYRPSQVVFSQDESRAFAVTQDGISVIDLGGPEPIWTQNFPLSAPSGADAAASDSGLADESTPEASIVDGSASTDAAAIDAPGAPVSPDAPPDAPAQNGTGTAGVASGSPDVSFTRDGYALVRQNGVPAITVVSLADGSPTRVALPGAPTDLTVSPDGAFAVAVLRDSATVAILPLPGIASDPGSFTTRTIPGETVGRAIVAENTTTRETSVLLFTTAAAIDRLTILTLQPSLGLRTIALHAPVLAVFPTADAKNAIVLHGAIPTNGGSIQGAFSVVPIAQDQSPKIVALAAPPTAVALSPTSDRALVTISDGTSIFGVELVKMPSFEVVPYTLASPPTAVGIAVAADQGFVAQNYTDGRITFINLSGGAARTITGFELSARVVQGNMP